MRNCFTSRSSAASRSPAGWTRARTSWPAGACILAPLPTDRIVMVGVRQLNPDERKLIEASDVTLVPIAGSSVGEAVDRLVEGSDLLYLHIDLELVDERLVPSHLSRTPGGPDLDQTLAAVERVLPTGKIGVLELVSVYSLEPRGDESLASGPERHPVQHGDAGFRAHTVLVDPARLDRAFVGYLDGGLVILDVTDPAHPRQVSRLDYHPTAAGFHPHGCCRCRANDVYVDERGTIYAVDRFTGRPVHHRGDVVSGPGGCWVEVRWCGGASAGLLALA